MAVAVVTLGTDRAQAARPDPGLTYVSGSTGGRTGVCNYTGVWAVSGVNGKFATIAFELRAAGASDWTDVSVEKSDVHESDSYLATGTLYGTQPEYVELRATIVKNNGTPMSEPVVSEKLSCA